MNAIDHDEIYLQPVCCVNEDIGRLWCEDADPEDCEDGKHWTRYVRADIHESAVSELESLRQERDGLRADAVRLDWVSCQSLIDLRFALEVDNSHDGEVSVCGDDQKIYYGKTLRAAIDAAMAKEQGDGN